MWFYIALTTSLISAISVIINKKILKGVSPSVLPWCTLLLATPIVAVFAIKEGIPHINALFAIGVTGSVIFYTAGTIIQFRAVKIADLSSIYPLVALAPILTLIVAYFPPLSEKPSLISVIGVLVTLFGAYTLNVGNAREGLLKPIKLLFEKKASKLMLLSVLLSSVIILFDKFAINNTEPRRPIFVLLVENILVIIGLLPILYLKNKNFTQQIFSNKKLFILLGILSAVSTTLGFTALGGGSAGIMSAILKSQLLFVLLFSFIFFKDKPRLETLVGSTIMILGVVLIKLGL